MTNTNTQMFFSCQFSVKVLAKNMSYKQTVVTRLHIFFPNQCRHIKKRHLKSYSFKKNSKSYRGLNNNCSKIQDQNKGYYVSKLIAFNKIFQLSRKEWMVECWIIFKPRFLQVKGKVSKHKLDSCVVWNI